VIFAGVSRPRPFIKIGVSIRPLKSGGQLDHHPKKGGEMSQLSAIESAAQEIQLPQYSRRRVLGLCALVTLPMVLLTWVITPALIPLVPVPAVLLYWILLLANAAWMIGLSLWILRREEGNLKWETIRARILLNGPRNPKTGQRRIRYYGWLFPCLFIAFVVIILSLFYQLFFFDLHWLVWPSFAYISEVGSPEFAGQWGWLAVVFVVWLLNMFLAEELFFRGLLLPRMRGAFGRLDWVANAILNGLFYLAAPFAIPFRFLLALLAAGPARRYRSTQLALAVRTLEGVVVMILAVIGVGSKVFAPLQAIPALPRLDQSAADSLWQLGPLAKLPTPSPDGEIDLRSYDLSGMDLSGDGEILSKQTSFSSKTVWPPADRMPADFDRERILDLGRNPGLGVRSLHARGITGRGVGIAIIDQPLLTTHEEFGGRLRWYEVINPGLSNMASMHGSAVSSLAVGRTSGVAPEADLYYFSMGDDLLTVSLWQLHYVARAIRRVLQLNEVLPAEDRIRVISISLGWNLTTGAGCYDVAAAVEEARARGVLVVHTSMENVYGIGYMGLGRDPLQDPDQFESYKPGSWWESSFYSGSMTGRRLYAPMDSRTTADFTGPSDYVFYRTGGLSWTTPWIAGVYALAVQVDPALTPERFLELAERTGRTVEILHEGKTYPLGPIIDPVALIAALKTGG
jgi:membrane protease YdiL (CAAX protease family)